MYRLQGMHAQLLLDPRSCRLTCHSIHSVGYVRLCGLHIPGTMQCARSSNDQHTTAALLRLGPRSLSMSEMAYDKPERMLQTVSSR